jgi:hypothetical protein
VLTAEQESMGDRRVTQDQIPALQREDVIERGLANVGVSGDQLVGCLRAAQRGRQYPGRA